jgi:hypothetical protein
MAEWLKAHAWKACLGETLTWVRIPLSPPDFMAFRSEMAVEINLFSRFVDKQRTMLLSVKVDTGVSQDVADSLQLRIVSRCTLSPSLEDNSFAQHRRQPPAKLFQVGKLI